MLEDRGYDVENIKYNIENLPMKGEFRELAGGQ